MMKHILVIGNEFLKEDNLAIEVAKSLKLKDVKFHILKDVDEVINFEDVIILDVVKDLKEIKVFNNLDNFKLVKSVTSHDLDLAFHLKLLKEMGQLKNVRIIGLPQNANLEEIRSLLPDYLKKVC